MKPINPKDSKLFELAQFQFKSEKPIQEFINKIPLNLKDLVLEIGPGSGRITKILSPLCKKVVAIEIDETCKNILTESIQAFPNIQIIWQDFLLFSLPTTPYKIVANIPFNQTRNILEKIITTENIPEILSLVLQTEVSEKICRPECEHTLLSAYIQNFYHLKVIKSFHRNDYQPPAHVDTVALLMEIKENTPSINKADFFQFIATTFEMPGQPLKNRLKKHFTFNQLKKISANLKINLNAPPHTLSSETWQSLFELKQRL